MILCQISSIDNNVNNNNTNNNITTPITTTPTPTPTPKITCDQIAANDCDQCLQHGCAYWYCGLKGKIMVNTTYCLSSQSAKPTDKCDGGTGSSWIRAEKSHGKYTCPTNSTDSSPDRLNAGSIVGIVVASVASLSVVVFVIYKRLRKTRNNYQPLD
ncbi:uncharacterized protein LOC128955437 [Oppia nitens]|uniref:uncharacterized protein LOC128955437 n=1 Tax=Oppia nitens TaxID=1686743 RepID=UPI0023DC9D51|nr:uncharacterized protein LOC128955437 [Oppia nitens]